MTAIREFKKWTEAGFGSHEWVIRGLCWEGD